MQALWNELLPPDWLPTQRVAAVLKASGNLKANPVDGFLSPYGATNPENDFNVYAETIFINPSHVARQADKCLVVAKKLALLMEAYIQLDNRPAGVFDRLHLLRFKFDRLHLLRFKSALPAPFREGIPVSISPSQIPSGQTVLSEP
jgi:hypothetical protein